MNYFEDHIGDYAAATAHLSWDEDMAYTRLIRAYYHAEKPIPKGQAYRLARASTPAQRRAVDTVLAEFFTLEEDGHHQKRCDEEIARYQDKQAKAKRSAQARWNAKPTQSESNANASPDAMRTHMPTHSEGNALQTPDTRHQTPESASHSARTPSPAAAVTMALKGAGILGNPSHPTLIALVEAGATPQEFLDAAPSAKGKGKPFEYLLSVVAGRRQEAAELSKGLHQGAMPQRPATQAELNSLAHGFATGVYGPADFDATPETTPETIDVQSRLIAP